MTSQPSTWIRGTRLEAVRRAIKWAANLPKKAVGVLAPRMSGCAT